MCEVVFGIAWMAFGLALVVYNKAAARTGSFEDSIAMGGDYKPNTFDMFPDFTNGKATDGMDFFAYVC